ncbi:integral membrane protein [Annulohypoxylon moriforme]|nr:integral membrane protein [Annulohypoxylon moriforme]
MSNSPGPDHGKSWGIDVVVGAFFGIAVYNALEVFILMFNTFRRKNTLYFWTILVANSGILLHLLYAFRLWGLAPNLPMAVFTSIGWILMSTGQSLVLYLRLHLVIHDRRKLRWILSLIIFTFITLQIPTTATFLALCASPPGSSNGKKFKEAFDVFKTAQLAGFLIQEAVISGVYVYAFRCTSQRLRMVREDQVKKMLYELIALVVIVILFDVALIVDELVGNYQVQTTLKPAVYSIKLKAELFVLNNLVTWMQGPSTTSGSAASNQNPRKPPHLERLSSGRTLTSEVKPHPLHVPSRVSSRVSSRAPSCVPSRTGTPDQAPTSLGKSVAMAETEERPYSGSGSEISPHSIVASEPRVLTGNGVKPEQSLPTFEKIDLGD